MAGGQLLFLPGIAGAASDGVACEAGAGACVLYQTDLPHERSPVAKGCGYVMCTEIQYSDRVNHRPGA